MTQVVTEVPYGVTASDKLPQFLVLLPPQTLKWPSFKYNFRRRNFHSYTGWHLRAQKARNDREDCGGNGVLVVVVAVVLCAVIRFLQLLLLATQAPIALRVSVRL